ncbi:MAG: lasso peptide biosynthesis protein [Clostridiales bacterium]|nr:lasso peptide biosynthesis protein [Clostridiales bacterium]
MDKTGPSRSFREKFTEALALWPAQSIGALAVAISFSQVFSVPVGAMEVLVLILLPLVLSLLEGLHRGFALLGFFVWTGALLLVFWRYNPGYPHIFFAVTAAVGVIRIFRRLPGGLIGCAIALISAVAAPDILGTPNVPAVVLACISIFLMFPAYGDAKVSARAKGRLRGIFTYLGVMAALFLVAFGITAAVKEYPNTELFDEIAETFEGLNRITSAYPDFELYQTGYRFGGPANPGSASVFRAKSDISLNLRCKIYTEYTSRGWQRPYTTQQYPLSPLTSGRHDTIFDNNLPAQRNLPEGFFRDYEIQITPLAVMHSIPVPVRFDALRFAQGENPFPVFNNLGDLFTDDIYSTVTITGRVPNVKSKAFSDWMTENADSLRENPQKMAELREVYCQLPDGLPTPVRRAAGEHAGTGNSYQKAKNIERWLSQNMHYTLTPGYPHGQDFVEDFLDTGEGYCVHFATAMTVLLRCQGIPARFVTGYALKRTGESIVTEKEGHAWCEVYFEGIGWIPFEPTAPGYSDGQPLPEPSPEPPAFHPETPTPLPTEEPTPAPTPQTDSTVIPGLPQGDPRETATPKPVVAGASAQPNDPAEDGEDDINNEKDKGNPAWLFLLLLLPVGALAVLLLRRRKLRCGITDDWRCVEYALRLWGLRRRNRAEPFLTYAEFVQASMEQLRDCGLAAAAVEVEAHIFGNRAAQSTYIQHTMQQLGKQLREKKPVKYVFYRLYCACNASEVKQ